ncbi:MAG: hypothetical protein ACOYJ6_19200 [Caulobacterales bacterium]
MIELGLGPAALSFVGASAPEDHALLDRVIAAHGVADFARHWLEARGLKAAADALVRFDGARSASAPAPAPIPAQLERAAL